MTPPSARDAHDARCLRVASAANARGVTLAKSERRGERALVVSGHGRSVGFPIVTDERTWRETSVEQAFYSVLVDARGWSSANVDDASLATIADDVERDELPLIRTDLTEELARIGELAEIVGGRAELENLWHGVDPATV
ncbi:MAG: hypothetical protein NVSMB19_01320 [Vulcanimicrobiaceae bacterium]